MVAECIYVQWMGGSLLSMGKESITICLKYPANFGVKEVYILAQLEIVIND